MESGCTKPLSGDYGYGQFVVVRDSVSKYELSRLGSFGDAKTGSSRRVRGDRILDRYNDDDAESIVHLTLTEAFFLAYALGCLDIKSSSAHLSIESCWSAFRQFNQSSNQDLDFAVEYGVYHYLRTRGWVVKSGENYGTNFLLYKEGPSVDHSKYAVVIVEINSAGETSTDWKALLTYYRVVQSVGKELLLVYVTVPAENNLDRPDCIRKMLIETKTFYCHPNPQV